MRRTTITACALTAVIAATAGWQLLHRPNSPSSRPIERTPTRTAAPSITIETVSDAAPTTMTTRTVEGPDGTDRSGRGAVRAAVRFLKLDQRLFPAASPAQARAWSDSITSSAARDRLGDRAEAHQFEALAKGDLAGLTLRLAPISTRVRNLTATSVSVDVFVLRLWSFPGKGALDDYATAEIRLVWENEEWRLADSSVIDGPYPVARFSARPTLASTAARFEDLLAGFDDTDLVP